jgi:hypothetical protein
LDPYSELPLALLGVNVLLREQPRGKIAVIPASREHEPAHGAALGAD